MKRAARSRRALEVHARETQRWREQEALLAASLIVARCGGGGVGDWLTGAAAAAVGVAIVVLVFS